MNETIPNSLEPMTEIVPMDLLSRAIASGADPAVWTAMMGLHERWEANQARKAFDHALANAKAEFGKIEKSHTVDFTNRQGIRTHYSYEDLNDIAKAVSPALSRYGLYYRWNTTLLRETPGEHTIIVTCIVAHRDGHCIENSLPGAPDNSAGKNPVQATGSVCTYLQRYTLKAALGLAAEEDDDGEAGGGVKSSGDLYVERWATLMEEVRSRDELWKTWNDEKALRKKIEWRGTQFTTLKEKVTRRLDELKQLAAAEETDDESQVDFSTQRLKAEDA